MTTRANMRARGAGEAVRAVTDPGVGVVVVACSRWGAALARLSFGAGFGAVAWRAGCGRRLRRRPW